MTELTFDLTPMDGEARVLDIELGERLGLAQRLNIRAVIANARDELETHGEVITRPVKTSARGGRPGKAYYLNEGQALTICALSRTPTAAAVRKALIDVFMAWRRGELKSVHVQEHMRRPPRCVRPAPTINRRDNFESFFRAFRDQPEALADWAEENARAMEAVLQDFTGQRRAVMR